MKRKSLLGGLLAICMFVAMFTGCTGGNKDKSVTLKYIMPGPGMQENSQQVWSDFNDKLHEKLPNVTVDFEIIPLSEYKQEVMLMMSAREQMDIVNNYGLDFATEVTNGSFAEMNDLLDEYGKDVKKTLPEWIWDYETVDGKIYGIPTYQSMGQTRCICLIKEYADKYLDQEGLVNALAASQVISEDVYDILGAYCQNLKDNGINFKSAPLLNDGGYDNIISSYSVVYGDDKCKVVNTLNNDDAKAKYRIAREWYEKGYIRQDSLSANDDADYRGKKDGLAFWDEVYTPYQEKLLSEKYGTDIVCIPYTTEAPIGGKALAGGTSIMSSSKHQKEAMQVLNLIQSDKEMYNLLVYGREGIDFQKVGEDRIETPYASGQGSANDGYGLYKWIVGNCELSYLTQADDEAYKEWAFNEVNNSKNKSKLIGFLPDTSAINDILTQVDALKTQYKQSLCSGALANWEETLAEFESKLKSAGDEKVIKELQKQVDEFLKNK